MKKILLATTLLSMSASYAAADIVFTGSATAGIAQNGTDNGGFFQDGSDPGSPNSAADSIDVLYDDNKFLTYSSATLAVAMSGATDGGLTFGAALDLTSGVTYDLGDEDGFSSDNSGAFGGPSIFIAGSFGKITFKTDGLDGYDGDETNDGVYDVQYDGTFGPVAVGVLADMASGLMAVSAAFSTGALALSANYTQDDIVDDIYNVSATYTLGMIAITASTDDQSDASLGVAYAGTNGVAASATYNTGTGADEASFDLTAGYTANSLAVAASVDNVSGANGGDPTWTVTASYDLGGGLTVEAGTNYTMDVMVGAAMAF